jgi:hypothetical protein
MSVSPEQKALAEAARCLFPQQRPEDREWPKPRLVLQQKPFLEVVLSDLERLKLDIENARMECAPETPTTD